MSGAKPPPTSTASKRIKKEMADLAKENLGEISLTPNEADMFSWRAVIPGPIGSPYEGGRFEVDIRIPPDYPFSAPKLHFITPVYHCNIAHTGAICLDLLKGAWSPALSLYKVILSLSSLLTDPNPADPLVPAIAQEYRTKRKQHDDTARAWVKRFAKPVDPYTTPEVVPAQTLPPPPPSAPGGPPRPQDRGTGYVRLPRLPRVIQAIPAASVQGPPSSLAAADRKRPTNSRPTANGSTSNGAGSSTRTTETIDLAGESEDEVEVDQSIEILGENPASRNQAGSSSGPRQARQPPPKKRARQSREDSDEIIFIDD